MHSKLQKNLQFTLTEYRERITKTKKAMGENRIDVAIITDPSNMAWLTGYDGWSFYVHQCVVLPLGGDPIWFGREQDANGARITTFMSDECIIGYPEYYIQTPDYHPMEYLATKLIEKNLGSKVIGVEMDNYYFSALAFRTLEKKLSNASFKDLQGLVNWQRAIKSPKELEYMRFAGKRVEKMHKDIYENVQVGMRKCDLIAQIYNASLVYDSSLGGGGDYPAIVPLVPSGEKASASHLTWDDEPMKNDEGTFFEISGTYKRYHCPLSRTVYLGKPPKHFYDAEQAILEGIRAGLEKARSGNLCEDIAIAFFDVLKKYNIVKNSRTGYPIGISYPPDWGERTMSLRPGDKSVLKSNMTFHFMTGLWMDTWGFEITESIVIRDGEPEFLANVPRKLFIKD